MLCWPGSAAGVDAPSVFGGAGLVTSTWLSPPTTTGPVASPPIRTLYWSPERAGGRQIAVAARLEHNAQLVRDAPDPEEVREALFACWSGELAAVLGQDPTARGELARLVTGFGGERRAVASEQTNTAHGSGTVFAVQHGNQQVYPPPDARS